MKKEGKSSSFGHMRRFFNALDGFVAAMETEISVVCWVERTMSRLEHRNEFEVLLAHKIKIM